jgi:hypothetical protein
LRRRWSKQGAPLSWWLYENHIITLKKGVPPQPPFEAGQCRCKRARASGGTMISYATQPDAVVLDGDGRNSAPEFPALRDTVSPD